MSKTIDPTRQILISDRITIDSNVLASTFTSFKIGGVVDLVAMPKSTDELIRCVNIANEHGVRYIVIGRGSNLLFSDDGYRGLVIKTEGIRSVTYEKKEDGSALITADCGTSLTALAHECAKRSLTGLEFAYGIPGSVGGAVYMNAGAYGGEMSNVVNKALCYDTNEHKLITLTSDKLKFDYRNSVFSTDRSLICLSVTMKLQVGNSDSIMATMNANKNARKEKQPLEYPSAGSVFKRHPGYFIGKIVDDMGLKGYTVGGAKVSEKHAGFIINKGNATANDVKALIELLSNRIFAEYGFYPECEIITVD